MNKYIWVTAIIFILTLSGCATPYQPDGYGGGYSEMALAKDMYQVNFSGNGYTSENTVESMLLRRCAELTIEKQYKYFVILQSNSQDNQSDYQMPTTVNTYGYGLNSESDISGGNTIVSDRYSTKVIIKMLNSNKGISDAFDANVVLSNFSKQ